MKLSQVFQSTRNIQLWLVLGKKLDLLQSKKTGPGESTN